MSGYIIRRVLFMIPSLLAAVTIVFVIFRLVPGDPAAIVAGETAVRETVEAMRHQMGLDQPIYIQYFNYVWGLLHGDLGMSLVYKQGAMPALMSRIPATVQLATAAMTIAVIVGMTVGVISALRFHSFFDNASSVFAVLGICMPSFWLGMLLMMVFSVGLRLLPTTGTGTINHLVLPAVTLSVYPMALIARMTRSSMLEAINQDYVRTARAKGLPERLVVIRHALRNALVPTITIVGLQSGYLLGGSIIVETVFAWPGIGLLMIDSIRLRDYTTAQGVTIFFSAAFLTINLLVDLLYVYVNPQVHYE